MKAKNGDLVFLRHPRQLTIWGNEMVKSWTTYPGEYGLRRLIWVEPGVALLLQRKKDYCRIFIHSHEVWVESNQVGEAIHRL